MDILLSLAQIVHPYLDILWLCCSDESSLGGEVRPLFGDALVCECRRVDVRFSGNLNAANVDEELILEDVVVRNDLLFTFFADVLDETQAHLRD